MLQPTLRFALAKDKTEDIDSLCALCQQALAIGEISCDDAKYLHNWIKENKGLSEVWPASIIYARLSDFLRDGVLDPKETKELKKLLQQFTGRHEATPYGYNAPSPFPLDDPAPEIVIPDHTFCFTGTFAFGNREACIEQIEALGGTFKKGMSGKVNYLVIGSLSNPHWAHATYGRKIEKAMTLKGAGCSTAIISEEQWIEAIVKEEGHFLKKGIPIDEISHTGIIDTTSIRQTTKDNVFNINGRCGEYSFTTRLSIKTPQHRIFINNDNSFIDVNVKKETIYLSKSMHKALVNEVFEWIKNLHISIHIQHSTTEKHPHN